MNTRTRLAIRMRIVKARKDLLENEYRLARTTDPTVQDTLLDQRIQLSDEIAKLEKLLLQEIG